MKIVALGTGSAFCMKNWQTNFAIQQNGKYLLVDCGTDIRFSLKDAGIVYKDIDGVYISHQHADHVGGLECVAFVSYFTPGQERPKLFAERELMFDLWDYTLRGGLQGLEGIDATLETYFDPHPVEQNGSFEWEGIKFEIVQSIHITAKYRLVPSFGLMFTDPRYGKRIFITTDVQFAPVQFAPETSMMAFYKEADLIVHDCETMYKSGVHAHYDSLRTLPEEIKKKIILTHYQDNVLDNKNEWEKKAMDDGFIGFVEPGVIYDDMAFVKVTGRVGLGAEAEAKEATDSKSV